MSNPTGDAIRDAVTYHELKSWPEYFRAVLSGQKNFEVRYTGDRTFRLDDVLVLREFEPCLFCKGKGRTADAKMQWTKCGHCENGGLYSGNTINCRITYMLKQHAALRKDHAVFGIKVLTEIVGGLMSVRTLTIDNKTKVARAQMAAGLKLMAEVIEKGGEWVQGGGILNQPTPGVLCLNCNLTVRFPDPDEMPRIQLN